MHERMTTAAAWMSAFATLVLIALATSPARVVAQGATSVVRGTVSDTSGARLPGVTVTLSSPALQVKQISVATGADGSYRFNDLPAGVYRLTFELSGFNTFVRDELRLTIGFTAQLDAALSVGQVQETVTVSGAAPVVDLTSSGTAANFTAETLNLVPRSRDLWMVVDMAPGVARPGAPDVGGSGMAGRRAMGAYGDPAPQPKLDVEGINIVSGGIAQSSVYFNDFGFDEVQFQTSGIDAEMGTPGLHMVAVMRSGGNDFRGRYEGSYQGAKLQSNNLTDSLRAQGLTNTQPLKYAVDAGADLGGRIIRDRLWFYGGINTQNRKTGLLGFVSGPGADGNYLTADDPAADYDNTLRGANLKMSWQLSKGNKLVGVYMLGQKLQPQESAGRFRPLEATRDYVNQSRVKKIELQSTVNSRLLINAIAGYGGFVGDYNTMRSKWYTGGPSVFHRDTGLRTGSDEMSDQRPRYNYQYDGSVSYFPERAFAGRHELKTGGTMYYYVHGSGFLDQAHGNYVLTYDGATPAEIQINNYPVTPLNRLNTYAWYLKDTWRMTDRLTANLGMRYERQSPFLPAQHREASPEFPTLFPAVDFQKTDILRWNRVLPRVGLSWSLNPKTVFKMTTGIYNYLWDEEDAGLYNLNAAASDVPVVGSRSQRRLHSGRSEPQLERESGVHQHLQRGEPADQFGPGPAEDNGSHRQLRARAGSQPRIARRVCLPAPAGLLHDARAERAAAAIRVQHRPLPPGSRSGRRPEQCRRRRHRDHLRLRSGLSRSRVRAQRAGQLAEHRQHSDHRNRSDQARVQPVDGSGLVLRHQEQPVGRAEHRQSQPGLLSQGSDVGLGQ